MKKLSLLLVVCLVLCIAGPSSAVITRCTNENPTEKSIYSSEANEISNSSEVFEDEVSEAPFIKVRKVIIFEENERAEKPVNTKAYEGSEEWLLNSKSYFVYDSTEGIVSLEGELDDRIYMASITKLYTVKVALEFLESDESVMVGSELNNLAHDSSVAGLKKGDVLTVEQLVAAMLLPSGNDAAYVMAVAAGRKILNRPACGAGRALEAFLKEMNRQAEKDGLSNTHFANPDGYHNDDHYTSMRDVLTIAKIVSDIDLIVKTTSMMSFDADIGGRFLTWRNTNLLVWSKSKYYRENVIGLKTGYTEKAGQCILVAERRDEGLRIVGVFGCDSVEARYEAACALLNE